MRRTYLILACALCIGCTSQPNDLVPTGNSASGELAAEASGTAGAATSETGTADPASADTGTAGTATEDAASGNADSVVLNQERVDYATAAAGVPPAGDAELAPVPISDGSVSLNPQTTMIQFVGTHAREKLDPRVGVFQDFTGTASVDPQSQVLQSLSVDIQTESLETPISKLTNHLKSIDFFDVRTYPTAKFESTSITRTQESAGQYLVEGRLTLMDSTRPVRFPARVTVSEEGLTLAGELVIDRTEFGMVGQDGVNKEIALSFAIGRKTELPERR